MNITRILFTHGRMLYQTVIMSSLHKGSVDHFGSLWPEKKMRTFLAIYGSRNSHFLAIYGPRNYTILVISGSGFWGQKSPKWCSFWDQKLLAYGYLWIFS